MKFSCQILLSFLFALFVFSFLTASQFGNLTAQTGSRQQFKLGNEILLTEKLDLIKNKNIGIITNNSGILSDGTHIVDAINKIKEIQILKIFSPEHGFRGDDNDIDYVDKETGIPVITLYGSKKKPAEEDLQNLDVLVYDIQDAGARFYTYVSTMYYCMEAAYMYNKKIIICDRPVIANPDYVDGFLLEEKFKSFIGMLDIPVAYGMTCGELASFINGECFEGKVDLVISGMKNYSRKNNYTELNLVWKKPSPNMYFPSTAVIYPGTCLLEGTNFSEGRGSDMPFEYVGAPYCNSLLLKQELDSYFFEGIEVIEISFIPGNIPGISSSPKYEDETCNGIYLKITDRNKAEPFKIGIAVLLSLKKLFPEFRWRKDNFIDKLAGTDKLREMIDNGNTMDEIIHEYDYQLNQFKCIRNKYLNYH